jgi:sulfate transport system permease protein
MVPQPASLEPTPPRANDPPWVRGLLISLAMAILTGLVVVPVVMVFVGAFSRGLGAYFTNLAEPATIHAMLLTLVVAPAAVMVNTFFGVAAAWAVTRFRFPGKTLLVALIDLPFAISPVVAGLMFVLLFGASGWFGPWLRDHGVAVMFNAFGLILATTFVTLPFVARELIPMMEAIGPDEELAAFSLGASGWDIFWKITLPNIKWGLLYGIILCNARAMGEFGAVYVVGGRISNETNTMPLQVDVLFNDFNSPAAFALASVLTFVALLTLLVKILIERQGARH